jgi:hypothetical protein
MNDPPETTTSRHCAFHHARPQYGRSRSTRTAGIFQGRSYEGDVRFFFDKFVGDVYVPFKKTDGAVGFRADNAYMFTPFEV